MVSKTLSFIHQLTHEPTTSARTYYRLARIGIHCSKLSIKLPAHRFIQTLQGQKDLHLLESKSFKQWLDVLIKRLNVEVVVQGQPDIESGLYVANHISWLDAVVIANISNFSFIAKNEVKQWPLIGRFGQMTQTLFIERQNKFSVYRSLPTLEQHLNMNRSILLFPEGTTSRGETVLPFFTMLYEAAVRTEKPIQAITLRYTDLNNHFLPEIGFVEDDNLFDTLFRMIKREKIKAHIYFHPPIEASALDRKQMACHTHRVIADQLCSIP